MNKANFLTEPKAHDWTYCYADGEAYKKGQASSEHLEVKNALEVASRALLYQNSYPLVTSGKRQKQPNATNRIT